MSTLVWVCFFGQKADEANGSIKWCTMKTAAHISLPTLLTHFGERQVLVYWVSF